MSSENIKWIDGTWGDVKVNDFVLGLDHDVWQVTRYHGVDITVTREDITDEGRTRTREFSFKTGVEAPVHYWTSRVDDPHAWARKLLNPQPVTGDPATDWSIEVLKKSFDEVEIING